MARPKILKAKYVCIEVWTLRLAQGQNTCADGHRLAPPQRKALPVVLPWQGRGSDDANGYQPQISLQSFLPPQVAILVRREQMQLHLPSNTTSTCLPNLYTSTAICINVPISRKVKFPIISSSLNSSSSLKDFMSFSLMIRKRWARVCCILSYGGGTCRTWYLKQISIKNTVTKINIYSSSTSLKWKKFKKDYKCTFQSISISQNPNTQVAKDSV